MSMVLTVSELSRSLKKSLETTFAQIYVKGEISGAKLHSSGHLYFSLKDQEAVLDGICWRGTRLSFAPQDGMLVTCRGKITTYPGRSKYQMIVEAMEMAGEGDLLKMLEERKKKLAAEGLFNSDRKKSLPLFPRTIAVITSPTGAVIRDILHRIADRFPCSVLVWPVLVQGEGAALQITKAIEEIEAFSPDVIIVARGGGSIEDLWAFNEESVVRAAAQCKIPLISAIGHETDITLLDFVADVRAPTPTAAAELATPRRDQLMEDLKEKEYRSLLSLRRYLDIKTQTLKACVLPSPLALIEEKTLRLDDRSERLQLATLRLMEKHQEKLSLMEQLLHSFSYKSVLKRGFSLALDEDNTPITQAADCPSSFNLAFWDDTVAVKKILHQ